MPGLAASSELVDAFEAALKNDRAYLNAQAEESLGQLDARRAGLIYLPSVFVERGRSAFEKTDRTTLQAVQPVVDVEKYTAMKEAPMRAAYAAATLRVRELELVKRVFLAYNNLMRSLALSQLGLAESLALERQVQRAQRRFELGYGSVMDVRLAQVQHSQALARYQSLQSEIQFSKQKLYSMTRKSYGNLKSLPLENFTDAGLQDLIKSTQSTAAFGSDDVQDHPLVIQAKEQLMLAEMGLTRAKSSYFPQLNLIVRNTEYSGQNDQYVGLHLSFPSGVSAFGIKANERAVVDLQRARRAFDEVVELLRLERESSDWALKTNAQEMNFRLNAVKVSEQNVAFTERAYEAGIVKVSDVVDAILASFEVRRQKLLLFLAISEQKLNNSLSRGMAPADALEGVSRFFGE